MQEEIIKIHPSILYFKNTNIL